MRRWIGLGILLLFGLAACRQERVTVPTPIDRDALATEIAANATQTEIVARTLNPFTPTITPSLTWTRLPTRTLTPTPSRTPTLSPTQTPTPTATLTPSPSASPSPTWTLTPSETPTITLTPTRALNPDAVVGSAPLPLLTGYEADAIAVTELTPGTALRVEFRTADNAFYQVRLLNGGGSGWVRAEGLILFIGLDAIPVLGGAVAQVPESNSEQPQGEPGRPLNSGLPADDLTEPQRVTSQTAGNGLPYLPYNYTACGDTYWLGDNRPTDGLPLTMEELAYQGRYPRFGRQPIRVYVHGLSGGTNSDEWELAISQAFAQLSQGVRLERVYTADLEFFQPWVPMPTLLQEARVDMVWHITDADVFAEDAPCDSPNSCSLYAYQGGVMGGPMRFRGQIFVPRDALFKMQTLVHAALHALGLWVHSPDSRDILAPDSTAMVMSRRDVNTLRCLYNAPPYGDARVE